MAAVDVNKLVENGAVFVVFNEFEVVVDVCATQEIAEAVLTLYGSFASGSKIVEYPVLTLPEPPQQ